MIVLDTLGHVDSFWRVRWPLWFNMGLDTRMDR